MSRREGTTLFMTLLAAFQTLLNRHTDEEDIVMVHQSPAAIAARPTELIGFFITRLGCALIYRVIQLLESCSHKSRDGGPALMPSGSAVRKAG